MSIEIVMPRLSDTMDSGTVARWNKQVGEPIKRGEVLLEIETDKANMDLESYADGILAEITVKEGESAAVGAPIALVASNEEELASLQDKSMGDRASTAAEDPSTDGRQAEKQAVPARASAAEVGTKTRTGRVKASPLARRVAEEHHVDLHAIQGTGPGERITREDVEAYLERESGRVSGQTAQAHREALKPAAEQPAEHVPMSRMQQTIARRMLESKTSAPHFYVAIDVDMTEARRLLQQLRDVDPPIPVGPNDLLIKAAGVALRRYPNVNASYVEGEIVRHGAVNVGNAVSLPQGLVVPVIHDVDQKSLSAVARESKELISRAHEGKLQPPDYEGGTFTLSNLGMFGVEQFTAIINPPESAILAVGGIMPKPVVVDGEIVIRHRMQATLSVDHRVVYGAEAAQFLAELKRLLEQPVLMLV